MSSLAPSARLAVLVLAFAVATGCGPAEPDSTATTAAVTAADVQAAVDGVPPVPRLAHEGWLVWDSDRRGRFEIWIRGFDRAPARLLVSPAEGSEVCCPRLSPDGRRVAFLAFSAGDGWPRGELRTIAVEGGEATTLAQDVALLAPGRAAVWLDARRLAFLVGDETLSLDVESGERRTVVAGTPLAEGGWMPDPTLHWASGPEPAFSPLDARGRVSPRDAEPGRRPAFSPDGRWGLFVGLRGGPIRRKSLATGERGVVLSRNDRRFPALRGEVGSPSLSSDGRLLAFVVTSGEGADKNDDVAVVEVDPATLTVVGEPVRYTSISTEDLNPDVWRAPAPPAGG